MPKSLTSATAVSRREAPATVPVRPTLFVITGALPPALNGIGDHTCFLTRELAGRMDVRVAVASQPEVAPIPGVAIQQAFDRQRLRGVADAFEAAARARPDWLLLQYQPFMYGPLWGYNPHLPLALRAFRRRNPGTRVAVMTHERFVTAHTAKLALMASWQRWQYAAVTGAADLALFSIEPWARAYRERHPARHCVHLPVGSNIARVPALREETRRELGVPDSTLLLCLFGTPSTTPPMLHTVRAAAQGLMEAGREIRVMHVGPFGERVAGALAGLPFRCEGTLPSAEVSRRLAAADLFLAPMEEGVSTRRGSLMAALQHGLPVVATRGALTDPVLSAAEGDAMLLSDVGDVAGFVGNARRAAGDAALCRSLGAGASRLYAREFDWPRVAHRLLAALGVP